MAAPMVVAKLPMINKLAHFNAILILLVAGGINLYQRFVQGKKGFWETVSRWVAIYALVLVIVTWFIRQGTGV